jgi:hypothetical protein
MSFDAILMSAAVISMFPVRALRPTAAAYSQKHRDN